MYNTPSSGFAASKKETQRGLLYTSLPPDLVKIYLIINFLKLIGDLRWCRYASVRGYTYRSLDRGRRLYFWRGDYLIGAITKGKWS